MTERGLAFAGRGEFHFVVAVGDIADFPGAFGEEDGVAVAVLGHRRAVEVGERLEVGGVLRRDPARGFEGGGFQARGDLIFHLQAAEQHFQLELADEETIIDAIVGEVPTRSDIDETVREALQDSLADGVLDDIDGDLDLDIPGAEAVADAVLDRLDVEPGLFGPLEEPLDVVLQEAVRDGLEDLGELDVGLPDLDGEDLVDLPDVEQVVALLQLFG